MKGRCRAILGHYRFGRLIQAHVTIAIGARIAARPFRSLGLMKCEAIGGLLRTSIRFTRAVPH